MLQAQGMKFPPELGKAFRLDRVAHPLHQALVIGQIVPACKPRTEHLVDGVEVAQISARVMPADVAVAGRVRRREVPAVTGIFQLDDTAMREKLSVAPVAGR